MEVIQPAELPTGIRARGSPRGVQDGQGRSVEEGKGHQVHMGLEGHPGAGIVRHGGVGGPLPHGGRGPDEVGGGIHLQGKVAVLGRGAHRIGAAHPAVGKHVVEDQEGMGRSRLQEGGIEDPVPVVPGDLEVSLGPEGGSRQTERTEVPGPGGVDRDRSPGTTKAGGKDPDPSAAVRDDRSGGGRRLAVQRVRPVATSSSWRRSPFVPVRTRTKACFPGTPATARIVLSGKETVSMRIRFLSWMADCPPRTPVWRAL